MILVILGICILLVIVGVILLKRDIDVGDFALSAIIGMTLVFIFATSTLIFIVCTCGYINDVSQSIVIDERIAMYQEENKSIETSINTIVQNYKDYEKDVFINTKNESIVVVATQIYPELKSNKLVKNQMDIYVANNKKIKQLKDKQLDYKVSKWWLYFGG